MAEVRCFVKGTKEQFDKLFETVNVRFAEFNTRTGIYSVYIRLPSHIVNNKPQYRFHRLKTINGLLKKLTLHNCLIK